MYISSQTFMVLGVSKSGYVVANYVLENGGRCFLYEEKQTDKIKANVDQLISLGANFVLRENFEQALAKTDVLIVSPGVPINHEVAVKAKRLGVRIMGELEFGFSVFTPNVIAVTGTNGKTTTCSMLDKIILASGKKSCLVGNIGTPITACVEQITKNQICITEVSSFQLETVSSFCPHISCILNIAPDHLERHYTMDNYVYLKKRIFKNQHSSEYCLLNYDDDVVRELAPEVKAKIIWVSCLQAVDGVYIKEEKIYYFDKEIMAIDQLGVKGIHNVYNSMFAIGCSKLIGIEDGAIKQGLSDFKGVKHRIELVGELDGVSYYNDSKATNVASSVIGIESMTRPTVLIVGGSEKGESYDQLFVRIKDSVVKHTVITGDSRYAMLESAGKIGVGNITVTSDFEYAVKIAKSLAKQGDNVLLSPACASYDNFKNYEERGEFFCKVLGLNVD